MILKNNKRIDGCSDTVPIGTLNPFLGSTAPYGYLICQGQKVSKTTYRELYEICGDTFGQSTDTEFYLPDLRGQTIAGYKEGDSTFGTLGGLVGSLTHLHSTGNHTLTVAEIPGHNHTQSTGYSSLRYKNGSVYMPVAFGNTTGGSAAAFIVNGTATGSASVTEWSLVGSVGGNGAHNHGDTSSTSSIQPTIVLNWIVKAFQLMPNQSYVENSLESDSTTNSLSAAKGKELNNKFNEYLPINGNAISATKASNDANNNNIVDTYATKNELANKTNGEFVRFGFGPGFSAYPSFATPGYKIINGIMYLQGLIEVSSEANDEEIICTFNTSDAPSTRRYISVASSSAETSHGNKAVVLTIRPDGTIKNHNSYITGWISLDGISIIL